MVLVSASKQSTFEFSAHPQNSILIVIIAVFCEIGKASVIDEGLVFTVRFAVFTAQALDIIIVTFADFKKTRDSVEC